MAKWWSRLFFRANDGTPPRAPEDDFWYTPLGSLRGTAAGIRVTPDIAIKASAVFLCVKILAETIGSLPISLYRRTEDGKEILQDHPLHFRLHNQPNEIMTASEFWTSMAFHAVLRGTAYAEIVPGPSGPVHALLPLHPDRVTHEVIKGARGLPRLRFRVTDVDGARRVLTQDEIFRFPGFTSDGVTGVRIVDHCADVIGLSLAADDYAARVFSSDLNIGLVLRHPKRLSVEAQRNLIDALLMRHAGHGKSHRPMVLQEDMKVERLGTTPKEAQLLDARKWQIMEVARVFNIPLSLLKIFDGATHCLPADVSVMTEHGPKSIAAVKFGERVWSHDGAKWTLASVSGVFCNGEDEIIQIKTENRTLRGNAKHRVLTRSETAGGGEWVTEWLPMGELKIGDTIVSALDPSVPERTYPRFGGKGFDMPGCQLGRIVSIEMQAAEPVYDLEVSGTHNFIANGIVVHNSNVEQQAIDFVKYTLRPWIDRIEQAIRRDLITERDKPTIFAKFNMDALLRGDLAARTSAYEKGVINGWLTRNEVREREDLNKLPGLDKPLTPLNMSMDPEGEPPPKEPEALAAPPKLLEPPRVPKVIEKEARKVRIAVERSRDDAEARRSIVNFYGGHAGYLMHMFGLRKEDARAYCAGRIEEFSLFGIDVDWNSAINKLEDNGASQLRAFLRAAGIEGHSDELDTP